MRMTIDLFALQTTRIRKVMSHLDAQLDDEHSLQQLADLACMSASALVRLYVRKIGEPPLHTLRRLRLKRAYEQIVAGRTNLYGIALDAGYSSQAAFSRAFTRQFGFPPSATPSAPPTWRIATPMRVEYVPDVEVLQTRYTGEARDQWSQARLLSGSLAISGATRWRNWSLLDRDRLWCPSQNAHIDVTHFVPAAGQPDSVPNVTRQTMRGGLYAIQPLYESELPRTLAPLHNEIRERFGCVLREAPVLLRELTVGTYTAPRERRIALYIPIAT